MGYKEITLKLPTDYTEDKLRKTIEKKLKIREFLYEIKRKSLDARRTNVYWQIQLLVSSEEITGPAPALSPPLNIPYKKRTKKVVVVGSGPAGFFSSFVLQKAGFNVTLIERGSDVKKRALGIKDFEKTGIFNPTGNYAFGEGGAGTFSDGKLTSRSKHILQEREFIISSYISSGAPEEIKYMSYPHLGSDNLKKFVEVLREKFLSLGGKLLFETMLEDLNVVSRTVSEAITTSGKIEGDIFIIAPGHSAYETYRMLIKKNVSFRTKNFALGSRVEHPQELINEAQWGQKSLPGLNAAEYRLTSKGDGNLPVYTFCMSPGGTIVPASAYKNINIVNGMSSYKRSGEFANAACVAGINLDILLGKTNSPLEALDWLESLEEKFYQYSDGFKAPICTIKSFINKKETSDIAQSSYPLGLKPAALWELLPPQVSDSIREGLKDFCNKLRGFGKGNIMGLESKSSSPIQAVREKTGLSVGFNNLYIAGEGSGYSGGIISSGADGIKAALSIIEQN